MIYFSNLDGGPITRESYWGWDEAKQQGQWFLSDGRIHDKSGYDLQHFASNLRYKIIHRLPDVDPDLEMDIGL